MAEDKSTDVLMMFVRKGNPIPASCRTLFTPGARADADTLLDGFKPGCFFEIQDIDLDIKGPSAKEHRSGRTRQGVQLNEISVTRQIDTASMVLMQSCIDAQDFDSASIIKRRAVGGSLESGQPYLRLDFDGVLITGIDWTDEHVVKETCTFITRGVQVRYRPQSASGALGGVSQAKWSMNGAPDRDAEG